MNLDFFELQDTETKWKLILEYKIRRAKYLKRLRNSGIKPKSIPKEQLKHLLLAMDKIEDIKKIIKEK